MISLSINKLGVFAHVDRPSQACQSVVLAPLKRRAVVEWKSGSVSAHPCRKRDMIRLMLPGASLGQWANRTLLADHRVISL